jgi:hypothetical protein
MNPLEVAIKVVSELTRDTLPGAAVRLSSGRETIAVLKWDAKKKEYCGSVPPTHNVTVKVEPPTAEQDKPQHNRRELPGVGIQPQSTNGSTFNLTVYLPVKPPKPVVAPIKFPARATDSGWSALLCRGSARVEVTVPPEAIQMTGGGGPDGVEHGAIGWVIGDPLSDQSLVIAPDMTLRIGHLVEDSSHEEVFWYFDSIMLTIPLSLNWVQMMLASLSGSG